MLRLVAAHRADDRARALVRRWQLAEMTGEMLLDLSLGLGEERQVPAVAERASERADGERARVPQRIQQARSAAELADTLRAPGEMVFFFARGLLERRARVRIARRQRLALVERLRADLTDMV